LLTVGGENQIMVRRERRESAEIGEGTVEMGK